MQGGKDRGAHRCNVHLLKHSFPCRWQLSAEAGAARPCSHRAASSRRRPCGVLLGRRSGTHCVHSSWPARAQAAQCAPCSANPPAQAQTPWSTRVTAFLDALVFPHGLDSLSDGCANVLLGIDSTALACHACEYDRGAACLARYHAVYPSVPPARSQATCWLSPSFTSRIVCSRQAHAFRRPGHTRRCRRAACCAALPSLAETDTKTSLRSRPPQPGFWQHASLLAQSTCHQARVLSACVNAQTCSQAADTQTC